MSEQRVRSARLRLLDRFRHLDEAAQKKWIKYTLSGLFTMLFGFILIIIGLLLNSGAYSAEGLLIGFGVIAILVGVVRLLIGFINPPSPDDIDPPLEPPEEEELDNQIFEQQGGSA